MTEFDGAGPGRLLIVDDEARIVAALRRVLRREGYELLTEPSAEHALARLERVEVDLVLSDHKMPGMSGFDLLSEVGRRWPAVRRVMITGWTEAASRQDLEKIGVFALIPKPWDDGQLKQTLRAALKAPARRRGERLFQAVSTH